MLILVPLDITLRLASLLILQVLKNTCIGTNGNIVVLLFTNHLSYQISILQIIRINHLAIYRPYFCVLPH